MPMLQGVIDFWVIFVIGNWILWFENTYILKNYDTIEKFAKAEHVSPCIWASIYHFMPKPILEISLIIKLSVNSPSLSPPIRSFRGTREVMKF
jgi:hypothetical protein